MSSPWVQRWAELEAVVAAHLAEEPDDPLDEAEAEAVAALFDTR